jgi:replication-associated recombination protein RarA
MTRPTEFRPRQIEDFIGQAQVYCRQLRKKCDQLRPTKGFFRGMFYGPPGCGKSELAVAIGIYLTESPLLPDGSPIAIQLWNGQDVTVDLIREWKRDGGGTLYSPWTVRIIDEWDRMNEAAQASFLSLLDQRRRLSVYITTTNLPLREIPERDQTRMQLYKFDRVSEGELNQWLTVRWNIPAEEAARIAAANKGNVRGALHDAETYFDRVAVALEVAA